MTKISKAAFDLAFDLEAKERGDDCDTPMLALARYIQQTSDVAKELLPALAFTLNTPHERELLQSLILPDDEPTPEEVITEKLFDEIGNHLQAALAAYTIIKREG